MINEFSTFCLDSFLIIELFIKQFKYIALFDENGPHFVPDVRLRTSCELTSGSVIGHMGIG